MSRSGLAAARTDEIGDEKHYRHKIDGDGDTIPDDLEKHLARQFLANQPDPAIWGTYMAGLQAGDFQEVATVIWIDGERVDFDARDEIRRGWLLDELAQSLDVGGQRDFDRSNFGGQTAILAWRFIITITPPTAISFG